MTRLSDIATVDSGAGFPIADQGASGEEFPFLKVSDMNLEGNAIEIKRWNHSVSETVRHRLRAKSFPAGTVIFPKIGAAIATNKKRLLTRPSCIDNNCMGVTGDLSRVEPWYLYYLFRAKDLSDFASASNPPSIRKTEIEAWDVPLPHLSKQRRIVDLLSRAENIVRMRREAEAKAKEIIPALFLDMFGDPARNERGWEVRRLGDVADIQGGLQVTTKRSSLPLEVPYLRVANVHRTHLDLSEIKTIRVTPPELERTRLRDGDLLVVEGHGNPAEIGRVGIWAGAIEPCTHQNHLIRVRCSPVQLDPLYVWASLNSAGGRHALLRQGKTTSGLNTISVSNVKCVDLSVPPIQLQRQFAARVGELGSVQACQSHAGQRADQAFQSLLAGVFGEGA